MKSYRAALKEVLDLIENNEYNAAQISEWIGEKLADVTNESMETEDLSEFDDGDIIYSLENADYYACIFKYNKNSETTIAKGPFLMYDDEMWQFMDTDSMLYDEPGVSYRLATEEEKELFKSKTL